MPISNYKDKNEDFVNELEKNIISLTLTHFSEKLLGNLLNFMDFIILINQYFLIITCNMILILDILERIILNPSWDSGYISEH